MIHRRHFEELESAVRVSRRAVTVGIAREPDLLAHHLYAHWYLRRPEPSVATALARPWQTWSPLWTADLDHGRSGQLGAGPAAPEHRPPTALHAGRRGHRTGPRLGAPVAARLRAAGPLPELDRSGSRSPPCSTARAGARELRPEIELPLVDLRPFLAADVPALTLRIGHGASLAQQPADGRSFGEHRCRLVAGAVSTRCAATTASRWTGRSPPSRTPGSTRNGPTSSGRTAGTGPGGPRDRLTA